MGLQSSLLLVGACIIVLVGWAAYRGAPLRRWWGARRAGARPEPLERADPVMDSHLSAEPSVLDAAPAAVPEAEAPAPDPGRAYAEVFGERGEYTGRPDGRIDFAVHLPFSAPVARDAVLGLYRQREYTLERARAIYGRHPKSGQWSNLDRDPPRERYSELALAIQLADTKGPVGESELNTLAMIASDIADQQGCRTRFLMSFEQALARAQELDRFCRDHDLLASINVLSNSPAGFGGRAIDQAVHRIGMQYGVFNIYHMMAADRTGQRVLFSLANLRQPGEFDLKTLAELRTPGVTLFMIVPCAPDPGQAFARMAGAANTLCRLLDGRSLDRANNPLLPEGLRTIRAQVDQIAASMHAHGIPPGSATAVRLFGDTALH
jgi:FtsZ-interacting cell division protein ZipA